MGTKFLKQLRLLIFFPFLVLGVGLVCSFSINSKSILIGILVLTVGGVLSARIGGKGTGLSLMVSALVFVYLCGEGVFYTINPYLSASGFNKKATEFDPIRGYRWLGNNIRSFRTRMGITVYDNRFYPNNEGWIMDQEYSYIKNDSTKKRWMILGDSFIAGIMLKTNLPNRAQQLLNDSIGNKEVELYSFAVDGGGIMNWFNIFFKEIIPNYEFDGIILAPYADNLYRDFMIMLIDTNGFMGRIDSVDWSEGVIPKMSDFKELKSYNNVYSDIEIEHFLSHPLKPFDWALKKQLKSHILRFGKNENSNTEDVKTISQLNGRMGLKKFTQLDSIISWCQSNQKQFVLASIPSREELKNTLYGERNQHKVDMDIIAKEYQLDYFDGYSVFKGLNNDEVDRHWLKYDGHWNQKGSDRYTVELVKYLMNCQ